MSPWYFMFTSEERIHLGAFRFSFSVGYVTGLPLPVLSSLRRVYFIPFPGELLCGKTFVHMNIRQISVRHASCRFWSAAIYCRFDKFWIAVRPRTALEYFGLRHVSCRFRTALRLSAVKQVPLSLPERTFGWYDHCHHIIPWYPITE